jgi:hypothetical protein
MSDSSKDRPEALETRPRIQFRLSYLIYLLTLVAVGFAVLRRVFEMEAGWQFNATMAAYVAVLTMYFALRFPILIRRLARSRHAIRARRAEMAADAENTRLAHREADLK